MSILTWPITCFAATGEQIVVYSIIIIKYCCLLVLYFTKLFSFLLMIKPPPHFKFFSWLLSSFFYCSCYTKLSLSRSQFWLLLRAAHKTVWTSTPELFLSVTKSAAMLILYFFRILYYVVFFFCFQEFFNFLFLGLLVIVGVGMVNVCCYT